MSKKMYKYRVKCDLSPQITTCLKLAETVRPDCCPIIRPIPYDAQCFIRDIGKELQKLEDRHVHHLQNLSDRIGQLALPMKRQCRFVQRCACPFTKTIEIKQVDPPIYTRTEQLALPTVRRLLIRRQHAIDYGDKIGEAILNRWLRYSLLSLYSRLGNVQPLERPKEKTKMTEDDKKRRKMILKRLSKPKKLIEPPKPERKSREIDEARLIKLSRPRFIIEDSKPEWELTKGMKKYKASSRIKEISAPVERPDVHTNPHPGKVSPYALRYKPSPRINEMSVPLAKRDIKAGAGDVGVDPFKVSENAKKYKCSKRMKQLAEAKEFENTHIRENPFAISPAALKAKASPRLLELCVPKQITPKKVW